MNELIAMWSARADQESDPKIALAIMQCVAELKSFRQPSEESFTRRALAKLCLNRDLWYEWGKDGSFAFSLFDYRFYIRPESDHLIVMAYDAVKNHSPEQIKELYNLCGVSK